jgi:hypothetical protein
MKLMAHSVKLAGQIPEFLFKSGGIAFVPAIDQEDIHQHCEAE